VLKMFCLKDELDYMQSNQYVRSVVIIRELGHTYHDRSGSASSPHQSPERLYCSHSVYTNHTDTDTQTDRHTHTHTNIVG